ncbi:MAG: N-acetylglucosamine transferase [Rhodobacteraceae bacterium PARR1]|nr:MAG: N-acetylglucosamine transferase [Rhodobacteraceae bacterium PARR1]
MLRSLHRWPGLLAAVLLIVIALGGAALSVFPALDRLTRPAVVAGQSVADLAAVVQAAHPAVEQIRRAPSGRITAYWFDGDTPGAAVIDPLTGAERGSADAGAVEGWLKSLHRALLLEDAGRLTVAAGAAVMLLMALSGAMLVARRMGGWRHWFAPQRRGVAGRWHTMLARVAVAGLLISSLTGLFMVAATFSLTPDDAANPAFPATVSGLSPLPPQDLPALQAIPVADLRDLTFPVAGDPTDAYAVTTATGSGYVDPGTGALLVWADNGPWQAAWEWAYLLHTGDGAALWGLILGLMVLTVPALAVTGILIWWRAWQSRPRLAGMVAADKAQTVILVASEGGTTWGFATTLGQALQTAGQGVHLAPLSTLSPDRYRSAKRLIVLAATWGDGDAPSSAKGAVERLRTATPPKGIELILLGFGGSSFPVYCGYASTLQDTAQAKGWALPLPLGRIDRQSAQDFARWGRSLGAHLGVELTLNHQPHAPRTQARTLAILRFALPPATLWQRITGQGFSRFAPGDLLGILPEGSTLPRFYSLASGQSDRFIEIAVRQHPNGLCSNQLLSLPIGAQVNAFLRPNPGFQPDRSAAPLILIGAGTGIGPLAGFVRAEGTRRPVHLWFGARSAETDLLYAEELTEWQKDGRLNHLTFAFSRSTAPRRHVQDALRDDAEALRALVTHGARIMVCGGRDMAQGVHAALAEILAPLGLSPRSLKAEGRYAEDSY